MAKWSANKISGLTEADWKAYKKAAKIKPTSWFKKSDASIGKCIKSYQSARTAWRNAGKKGAGLKDAVDYHTALTKLHAGFKKFVNAKEFKSELAKELQTDIAKWTTQLDAKVKKVGKHIVANKDALKSKDAGDMMDDFKKWGMG